MIKIDIVSGFLGAGKTTLIRKLFESKKFQNEKVVIIENEFGEIGIDGAFLKGSGVKIKEINAGCICCSLVGDFEKSITELVTTYSPDRIIIEPSGVGKLSDIINAVKSVKLDLVINMLVTVVDGSKVKMYLKNFGEFFINQVSYADTIVVAKIDKCSEDKLVESVELIKQTNSKANVITSTLATMNADKLVDVLETKSSLRDELIHQVEESHHHHHDEDECDEHECECHHHHHDEEECDDPECECHHHHHDEDECDDPECECHHHHHHDEEECDDPECECHHHHHDEDECDDPECECHHHHHHHGHDADEVFTSWGIETPRSYSHDELEGFLKVLADENSGLGIILRSKGILKASDNEKWYYFDFVAGDYEIRLGDPDYTGRIVVIGSHIDEDKIADLFNKKVSA